MFPQVRRRPSLLELRYTRAPGVGKPQLWHRPDGQRKRAGAARQFLPSARLALRFGWVLTSTLGVSPSLTHRRTSTTELRLVAALRRAARERVGRWRR
jgi:hypothetical protein